MIKNILILYIVCVTVVGVLKFKFFMFIFYTMTAKITLVLGIFAGFLGIFYIDKYSIENNNVFITFFQLLCILLYYLILLFYFILYFNLYFVLTRVSSPMLYIRVAQKE